MLVRTTDINKLFALEQICFKLPYSLKILQDIITTHECYFIYLKNEIAGYMIMLKSGDDYELIRIAIIKQYQHKKLALNALLWFINEHQKNIYLEVSDGNIPAIKLYESLGFEVINIRKKYYSDDSNGLIMYRKFVINQ